MEVLVLIDSASVDVGQPSLSCTSLVTRKKGPMEGNTARGAPVVIEFSTPGAFSAAYQA